MDPVQRTLGVYERIAPEYARAWFGERNLETTLERFLALLPEPGDVLDAGCGPGRDVLAMAGRGVRAIGVDLSPAMLAEARSRVPGGVFRRMDLRALRYPDASFDGAWACASLHHLSADGATLALAELARVLRPGGVLGLIVERGEGEGPDHLGRHLRRWTEPELACEVEAAGLAVLGLEAESSIRATLAPDRPRQWLHLFASRRAEKRSRGWRADCPFCPECRFELIHGLPLAGAESILWGDRALWLALDVAPVVPAHLLLVSTDHHPCFGAAPPELDGELRAGQRRARRLLAAAGPGPVVFMEHGPARPRGAGACIEHAHWHCLATALPVRAEVERRLGPGRPAGLPELRALYQAGRSYLYLEDGGAGGPGHVFEVEEEELPSQFLREVVASLQGEEVWRWQVACAREPVQQARRALLDRLIPALDALDEQPGA